MADLYRFLDRLKHNNTREWFNAHRDEYDDLRRRFLEDLDRMLALMATWDTTFAGMKASEGVWRINRDTRFSLDKSPYKTHFSAGYSRGGRKSIYAGYFLDLGYPRDYETGLYVGKWMYPTPVMTKLRKAIVDNIEEFEEIIHDPALLANFPSWCSDSLKKAPKGWDPAHPNIDLLRLVTLARHSEKGFDYYNDPAWPEKTAEIFHTASPLINFINYSIDED